MVRMLLTAGLAGALCCGIALAADAESPSPPASPPPLPPSVAPSAGTHAESFDGTRMAEDIEIMCRIMDRTLAAALPDSYYVSSYFRAGARGFYLPGWGVVLSADVDFPVAPDVAPTLMPPAPPSNWEQVEREVRQERAVDPDDNSYTEAKVEKLREALVQVVGANGANIDLLGSSESIAVVVHGLARRPIAVINRRSEGAGGTSAAGVREFEITGTGPGTTMVLRVSAVAVHALARREMSEDDFAAACDVVQY